jgi:hypothetical protein
MPLIPATNNVANSHPKRIWIQINHFRNDIEQTAAVATRHQLLSKLAREGVLIATPHTSLFPALGRLREEGSGYSWVPVVFTDQWDDK